MTMVVCKRTKRQTVKRQKGKGFVNSIINKLPIELHVPGYQYCGPGTKLAKRLARGDPGINPLDAACKEHDIAYSQNRENLAARHEADRILAEKAKSRVSAKDSSVGEKAVAWAVAKTMKVKRKFGMGSNMVKKKKRSVKKGKGSSKKIPLQRIVEAAKASMQPGNGAVKTALKGAREAVKQLGGKKKIKAIGRVLPIPSKIGGILPAFLIPLFAGLSATGALAGGAAGIAKAVNDSKAAKESLEENKRHNRSMEAIALGKGLYMKPYKQGLGLYMKPKNV